MAAPVATPRHRRTPHRAGRRTRRAAVLAAVACVAAGALWWSAGPGPVRVGLVGELGAAPVAPGKAGPAATDPAAGGAPDRGGGHARPTDAPGVQRGRQVGRAAVLLRRWDSARAKAYARGSVRALRNLYAAPAGRADVRLLRSYLARGYRVEGARTQLLAVEVLDHRPGRWLLRVTDRLAGAAAVGHGRRIALPRDRAERQDVTLVRGRDGHWRVAEVSEGPAPAPTRRPGAGR